MRRMQRCQLNRAHATDTAAKPRTISLDLSLAAPSAPCVAVMQKPINGFRYKCSKCKDHDICESCHATFLSGTLPHANKLNPMVSKDVSAHSFHAHVDGKSFKAIGGGKKSEPAVKKAKVKPNDPCTCNSGKVSRVPTYLHNSQRATLSNSADERVGDSGLYTEESDRHAVLE